MSMLPRLYFVFAILLTFPSGFATAQQPNVAKVRPETWKKLQEKGVVRVIVTGEAFEGQVFHIAVNAMIE